MSVMPAAQPVDWIAYFRSGGYPEASPLAAGMEGAVYSLGGGSVAKVWTAHGADHLHRLQAFYADIRGHILPFDTPVIEQIVTVGSLAVSIEQELRGEPLQRRLTADAHSVPAEVVDSFVQILASLARIPATPAMRAMRVLGEPHRFRAWGTGFQDALRQLLERRLRGCRSLWQWEIPDFDRRYEALQRQLLTIDVLPDAVMHGDLFGPNVLVTGDGRVSAVLDFGFFSTAGDPRFDAAICAAVVDMYGPSAPQIMEALTQHFSARLGYPAWVLRVYQLAYALATSTVFSADGTDGHARWCLDQWRKPQLLALL